MKYAIIRADTSRIAINEVDDVTLEILQREVGGYIEYKSIVGYEQLPPVTMYMNEDGKSLNLPYNPFGDAIAWKLLHHGDHIVGNIVLCGWPDKHGDNTTLPDEWIEFLERDK